MKKILFTLFAFSMMLGPLWAQDSLSIKSIEIIQLDSGFVKPFYTDIPTFYQLSLKFNSSLQNNSQDTITDLHITYKFITKDSLDSIHVPFVRHFLSADTLFPTSSITLETDSTFGFLCVGNYKYRTIVESKLNAYIDSAERFFSVSDTTLSKDFSDFSSETGPSHYADTVNGIFGGDTIGDRFGTLFQNIDDSLIYSYKCLQCETPTSLSFYISDDTNNIGISIKPKIWEYNEDSLGTPNVIGRELLSKFTSTTINASNLAKWVSFDFDFGLLIPHGNNLKNGEKYIAGWETTSRISKNNYLEVNHDTSALKLQPKNTSYVFFGHAPSQGWMAIDDLPAIRVNYGLSGIPQLCSYIVSTPELKEANESPLLLYPNPVRQFFTLETQATTFSDFQLFNVMGQQFPLQAEKAANGFRFDAQHLPKGLYILQLGGEVPKAVKFIKK